jgi:hypothetical protein
VIFNFLLSTTVLFSFATLFRTAMCPIHPYI